MDLSELGKTVAKFAPALGIALGGPLGGAIGAAVASKFGGGDTSDLAQRIEQDPQAALKLAELQNELKIAQIQADSDNFKEEVIDKESARQKQIDLAKLGIIDNTPRNLTYILIIGFLGLLYLMPTNYFDIHPNEKSSYGILVGMLAASVKQSVDFIFGSFKDFMSLIKQVRKDIH